MGREGGRGLVVAQMFRPIFALTKTAGEALVAIPLRRECWCEGWLVLVGLLLGLVWVCGGVLALLLALLLLLLVLALVLALVLVVVRVLGPVPVLVWRSWRCACLLWGPVCRKPDRFTARTTTTTRRSSDKGEQATDTTCTDSKTP